jgi:hypothetical protein
VWTCENGSSYISRKNSLEFGSIEEAKRAAQNNCEEMVHKRFLKYFDPPPKRKVLVEKSKKKIARKNKRRPVQRREPVRRVVVDRYWCNYIQEVGV